AAISAIDIALWDLKGKALGQPVFRLLGGPFRSQVRAYATGLYRHRVADNAVALVREAEAYAAEGFRAMKMKVGFGLDEDARNVGAVRAAIGSDRLLAMDANHAYDAGQAIRLGRKVEAYDLAWFEEPVVPEDLDGYCQVKAALDPDLGRRDRVHALGLPGALRAPRGGHPAAGPLRVRRLHRGV